MCRSLVHVCTPLICQIFLKGKLVNFFSLLYEPAVLHFLFLNYLYFGLKYSNVFSEYLDIKLCIILQHFLNF
jgi:hypothetical protein